MSEERNITQEDLMKAREQARKKVEANTVTGDIVTAQPLEKPEKSE